MPCPLPARLAVVFTLGFLLLLPGSASAAKKKGGSKGNSAGTQAIRKGIAIRQQIAASAQQRLQAAMQKGSLAESELSYYRQGASQAIEESQRANQNSRVEADNVGDIEGDVLSALAEDSPYRLAEARYLKASDDYERVRRNILTSETYLRAYEIARRGPDPNESLTALRKESLEGDPKLVAARTALLATKAQLGRELSTVLSNDPNWLNAVEVSRDSREAELKARLAVRSQLVHKLGATSSRNEALKVANEASSTLQRTKSEITRLEQALKGMQSRGRRSSSNGGSKSYSKK